MTNTSDNRLLIFALAFLIVSVAAWQNLGSYWNTGVDIHNNWDQPIDYAIKSSPEAALVEFQKVKKWMETNNLTEGNTCAFGWQQSPYCSLSDWYNERIKNTIKDLESIQPTQKPASADVALVMNQIKTRHEYLTHDSGWEVSQPDNLNQYLRYHTANIWFGLWDFFSSILFLLDFLVFFIVLFS